MVFAVVEFVTGLRVSEAEELSGLDVAEHGIPSYPEFLSGPTGAVKECMCFPARVCRK